MIKCCLDFFSVTFDSLQRPGSSFLYPAFQLRESESFLLFKHSLGNVSGKKTGISTVWRYFSDCKFEFDNSVFNDLALDILAILQDLV